MHNALAELFRECYKRRVLQCVAVRCSVLQCVAVCCSALQCVAEVHTERFDWIIQGVWGGYGQ